MKFRIISALILSLNFSLGFSLGFSAHASSHRSPGGHARATARTVASVSPWSLSSDASVLKKTFRPLAGEAAVKAVYTCEGVAGASAADSPTAVQPRAVFKGPENSSVWVCGTEHGVQLPKSKAANQVVHTLGNVAVFFKVGDRAPKRLISQTGELAHPVDVEVSGEKLYVVDNYVIRKGAKIDSWRPMTRVEVGCEAGNCTAAPPKCVLALQKKDDRQIVAHFDQAVRKYKGMKTQPAMEKSEPFQLLDQLLLIAASGDKKASERLQNFPIQPQGEALELLGKYVDQLDRFKAMGCFSANAAL